MHVCVVEDRSIDRDISEIGALVPGDDAKERRFSAPRGTQDCRQRAGRHRQVETSKDGLVAERLVQIGDDDIGGRRRHRSAVARLGSRWKCRASTNAGTATMAIMTSA